MAPTQVRATMAPKPQPAKAGLGLDDMPALFLEALVNSVPRGDSGSKPSRVQSLLRTCKRIRGIVLELRELQLQYGWYGAPFLKNSEPVPVRARVRHYEWDLVDRLVSAHRQGVRRSAARFVGGGDNDAHKAMLSIQHMFKLATRKLQQRPPVQGVLHFQVRLHPGSEAKRLSPAPLGLATGLAAGGQRLAACPFLRSSVCVARDPTSPTRPWHQARAPRRADSICAGHGVGRRHRRARHPPGLPQPGEALPHLVRTGRAAARACRPAAAGPAPAKAATGKRRKKAAASAPPPPPVASKLTHLELRRVRFHPAAPKDCYAKQLRALPSLRHVTVEHAAYDSWPFRQPELLSSTVTSLQVVDTQWWYAGAPAAALLPTQLPALRLLALDGAANGVLTDEVLDVLLPGVPRLEHLCAHALALQRPHDDRPCAWRVSRPRRRRPSPSPCPPLMRS